MCLVVNMVEPTGPRRRIRGGKSLAHCCHLSSRDTDNLSFYGGALLRALRLVGDETYRSFRQSLEIKLQVHEGVDDWFAFRDDQDVDIAALGDSGASDRAERGQSAAWAKVHPAVVDHLHCAFRAIVRRSPSNSSISAAASRGAAGFAFVGCIVGAGAGAGKGKSEWSVYFLSRIFRLL